MFDTVKPRDVDLWLKLNYRFALEVDRLCNLKLVGLSKFDVGVFWNFNKKKKVFSHNNKLSLNTVFLNNMIKWIKNQWLKFQLSLKWNGSCFYLNWVRSYFFPNFSYLVILSPILEVFYVTLQYWVYFVAVCNLRL